MPCVANTALVCSTPPASGSHTHSPSDNHRSLEWTMGSRAPTGGQQNPFACRLEGIRLDLQAGQASSIVLAAQRTSTQNQYKSCWAKWVGWCGKQQIDAIQPAKYYKSGRFSIWPISSRPSIFNIEYLNICCTFYHPTTGCLIGRATSFGVQVHKGSF